jgi:DNA-binding response OmpR family regulator
MPTPRSILIVEDDALLRATLAEQIALESDFEVEEAGSASEAERKLSDGKTRYDAILLDIGLPDRDGCDVCVQLRREGKTMPIIMLTGRDSEADVVRGLDAGANDYVAKPFRLLELLARLKAQLRLFDISADAVLPIGPFLFHPASKLLIDQEQRSELRLTEKETAILRFLYRADNKTVPKHVLLNEVWGYTDGVYTHTLETHVYRLRQKIEREPTNARMLLTEHGGYRLNAAAA